MELKNISVSLLAGLITALGTIAGAIIYVDTRYAHASDVDRRLAITQQRYDEIARSQSKMIDVMRKQTIEDRIFEIDMKSKPSQLDNAIKQRFLRELNLINERLK